ncbi:MAG: GxxExxY protein, partial [Vicinamibacterales bacterium]
VMIEYRGVPLRPYRIDLVVGGRVIVEVKAVARFEPVHAAQLASYLRATRLRAGLLLNFNVVRLSQGLKRIVV